jgi:hypothetical protein
MTLTPACEDVLEAVLLGRTLSADATRHVAECPRCAAEAPALATVATALAEPAAPPPALGARVAAAVAPALARLRQRALARAIGLALLPLPLIVLVDAWAVRAVGGLLADLLPRAIATYLVFHWTAVLALWLALATAAVPLLAERQLRVSEGGTS